MYPICWILSILLKYKIVYQISLKSTYGNKISVTVRDLQTSSRPLIYKTEFSDVNLRIGDNILSQNWQQKKLVANYFSDKNIFRFVYIYILIQRFRKEMNFLKNSKCIITDRRTTKVALEVLRCNKKLWSFSCSIFT